LNLLAGLGWYYSVQWIASRFSAQQLRLQYIGLVMVLLLQVWSAASYYPYYFTYRNPIMYSSGSYRDYPNFPYGEGLEIAAQYLAELPGAANTTVLSYYSRGCFSYYYPGRSVSFRPYYVDGDHAIDLLRNLEEADYLIVYYANQSQLNKYDAYLDILSKVEPVHVIWMNGYEYVRIYRIDTFSPETIQALADL
jgi:hypothetical protein